jgi:hypothetical protein
MSSNDKVVITEIPQGYHIDHRDAESDVVIQEVGTIKNLRDALICADEYCRNEGVEYGYTFIPLNR